MTARKTPAKTTAKPAEKQAEPRPEHAITDLFEFTSGDTTITLPYVEHIPMGVLEDAVGAGKTVGNAIDSIIADLTKDQTEARRSLPLSEYGRLISEWDEASASKLGELFG